MYIDTTTENLVELERHADFTKLSRWIVKLDTANRFALSIHSESEVRNNLKH